MRHEGINNAAKTFLELSTKFVFRHKNINHKTAVRSAKLKKLRKLSMFTYKMPLSPTITISTSDLLSIFMKQFSYKNCSRVRKKWKSS